MKPDLFQKIQALCRHCPDTITQAIAESWQQHAENARLDAVLNATPVTSPEAKRLVKDLLSNKGSLTWRELGLCLTGATAMYHHMRLSPTVELLWTGPDAAMPTRRMEQAVLDLIRTSKQRILLVTFAAFKIEAIILELGKALGRGCHILLILESRADSESQLSLDAHRAFSSLPPGANIYYWPLENRPRNSSGRPAKLHTKCAVGDNTLIVGSANLTDDAMSRNMELGIRLDGGDAANNVWNYYSELINCNILNKLNTQ